MELNMEQTLVLVGVIGRRDGNGELNGVMKKKYGRKKKKTQDKCSWQKVQTNIFSISLKLYRKVCRRIDQKVNEKIHYIMWVWAYWVCVIEIHQLSHFIFFSHPWKSGFFCGGFILSGFSHLCISAWLFF